MEHDLAVITRDPDRSRVVLHEWDAARSSWAVTLRAAGTGPKKSNSRQGGVILHRERAMSKPGNLDGQERGFFSRRQMLSGAAIPIAVGATLDELNAQSRAVAATNDPVAFGPAAARFPLSINGSMVAVEASPATTLVEVLRQHLELTGTKVGCDRGACSACTVWLDGEVVASCMTFALDARGKKVTTIEGLPENGKLHRIQQAFIDHDALQCGFCTPGMVMSCAALVGRNANPALDDVKKAISGHLCRCGTYNNIFTAVLSLNGQATGGPDNG